MKLRNSLISLSALTLSIYLTGCGGGHDHGDVAKATGKGKKVEKAHEHAKAEEKGHEEHGEHKEEHKEDAATKEHGEHKEHAESKEGHKEHGGHAHGEVKVEIPTSYAKGLDVIHGRMKAIAGLIESGKLTSIHKEAAVIRDIAKALPGLATKADSGISKDKLIGVNRAAKGLAAIFSKIDEVADAEKMEETKVVFAEMKKLVEKLGSSTGDHKHHD